MPQSHSDTMTCRELTKEQWERMFYEMDNDPPNGYESWFEYEMAQVGERWLAKRAAQREQRLQQDKKD